MLAHIKQYVPTYKTNTMKIFLFFLNLLLTLFFANDKFSTAVRVIAFKEDESKNGAIISFLLMFIIAIGWTVFYAMF